jgi:hypothetical protein
LGIKKTAAQECNLGYTGYFTSDNEPGGIENATYNTSGGKAGYLSPPCPGLRSSVLWVAFSIPPGSISLVKYPVFWRKSSDSSNLNKDKEKIL